MLGATILSHVFGETIKQFTRDLSGKEAPSAPP